MRLNALKKGQAMAELVIVIPLLLLLVAGIYQFTSIYSVKMKLVMLERELMMYCSTTDDVSKIKAFAMEFAGEAGLEKSKLDVTNKTLGSSLGGIMGFIMKMLNYLGFGDTFYGEDISVTYTLDLIKPFWPIAGRQILLREKIHSGVGQVWAMDLNPLHVLENVIKAISSKVAKVVKAVWHLLKKL